MGRYTEANHGTLMHGIVLIMLMSLLSTPWNSTPSSTAPTQHSSTPATSRPTQATSGKVAKRSLSGAEKPSASPRRSTQPALRRSGTTSRELSNQSKLNLTTNKLKKLPLKNEQSQ